MEAQIWTLIGIITWKYIGFAVILFMAAMRNIPDELSEAAAIDGASYWQIQRYVTLPLLGPTVRIWANMAVMSITHATKTPSSRRDAWSATRTRRFPDRDNTCGVAPTTR